MSTAQFHVSGTMSGGGDYGSLDLTFVNGSMDGKLSMNGVPLSVRSVGGVFYVRYSAKLAPLIKDPAARAALTHSVGMWFTGDPGPRANELVDRETFATGLFYGDDEVLELGYPALINGTDCISLESPYDDYTIYVAVDDFRPIEVMYRSGDLAPGLDPLMFSYDKAAEIAAPPRNKIIDLAVPDELGI